MNNDMNVDSNAIEEINSKLKTINRNLSNANQYRKQMRNTSNYLICSRQNMTARGMIQYTNPFVAT